VFAQWEREEIAERVSASVLIRAKLGKSINGTSPYDYVCKDRKLVIQPEEAAVRRKTYELFLQYHRKEQVSKALNAAGYRTRDGNIWRDTSILRILNESSAKGTYVFNTMRMTGTWRTELKPGKQVVHLFSGLAHCSCESRMYVAANNPKYFCRKCRNKIPIVDLENIARRELKSFFGKPERIAGHLREADQNLTEKSTPLDTHRREVQKVKEEMHQTHQLYLKQQISGDGFRDLYGPAEERLKQLNAELPKLEAEVDFLKVNRLSATDVLHEANSLDERWRPCRCRTSAESSKPASKRLSSTMAKLT
jgi:site-specific DNA recombinase